MKVAAVSPKCIIGDVQHNLGTTINWVERLNDEGVDFILFPELSLSGYTNDLNILEKIYMHSEETFDRLFSISEDLNIAFAVGFPEIEGDRFYISHFLISEGKLAGIHRKTHLGPTEKDTFEEGDVFSIFQVGEFKVGFQLCYETHFPEISYAQVQQGADLLAMAFASPKEDPEDKLERFKRFLPARAYDNSCFVMACNQDSVNKSGSEIPGLSLIINPKGIVLEESVSDIQDYVVAELDRTPLDQIKQSKMGWFNSSKRSYLFEKYYTNEQ